MTKTTSEDGCGEIRLEDYRDLLAPGVVWAMKELTPTPEWTMPVRGGQIFVCVEDGPEMMVARWEEIDDGSYKTLFHDRLIQLQLDLCFGWD